MFGKDNVRQILAKNSEKGENRKQPQTVKKHSHLTYLKFKTVLDFHQNRRLISTAERQGFQTSCKRLNSKS